VRGLLGALLLGLALLRGLLLNLLLLKGQHVVLNLLGDRRGLLKGGLG